MLVVDDHPIFRDGLRASLAEAPDLELCGEASTPAEATNAVERLAPDVVLMDVDLAGESGIEVTHRVTQDHPEVAVLMLTMHGAESTVFAAVCAGAVGYLLKGSGGTELHRAVRAAAAGEAIFGAGVARRVLSRLQAPQPHQAGPDHNLTVREREILDLMAGGLGNHAIAVRLSVAPKTVRNNVSSIRSKLRAASRLEAVDRARTCGYGRVRPPPDYQHPDLPLSWLPGAMGAPLARTPRRHPDLMEQPELDQAEGVRRRHHAGGRSIPGPPDAGPGALPVDDTHGGDQTEVTDPGTPDSARALCGSGRGLDPIGRTADVIARHCLRLSRASQMGPACCAPGACR